MGAETYWLRKNEDKSSDWPGWVECLLLHFGNLADNEFECSPMKDKTVFLVGFTEEEAGQIQDLFSKIPGQPYQVFVEISFGEAAWKSLASLVFDALILNLDAEDVTMNFLRRFRLKYTESPVLAVGSHAEEATRMAALESGAQESARLGDLTPTGLDYLLRSAMSRIRYDQRESMDSRYLKALLEASPDHIYFKDSDGRFIRTSQSLSNKLGREGMEELSGYKDVDFFSPEHARRAYQDEQEVMRTGKPILGKLEKELLPDGSFSWVSTTRLPLYDADKQVVGTMGISRDVTERVEAEQALERERLFLKTIIDSISDVIFVKDREGRYMLSNPTHRRNLGLEDADQIIGKTVYDFFGEDIAGPFHESDLEALRSGESVLHKEEKRMDRDGNERWYLTSKIPFSSPHSDLAGIVGISRDITRQKELEQQLEECRKKGC